MDESEFEFAEVYSALLDELPPVRLPPHLQQGQVEPVTARLLTADSSALINRLKQFGRQKLLAAGVWREQPGKSAPAWGFPRNRPGAWCLGLTGEDGRCYEVLTSAGCLSRRELPLTAMLRDATCRRQAADSFSLFVTFSLADLVVLRALGLPATTAWDLDRLGGRQLSEVQTAFGLADDQGSIVLDPVMPDPAPRYAVDDDEQDELHEDLEDVAERPAGDPTIKLRPEAEHQPPADEPLFPPSVPANELFPFADLELVLVGWSPYKWNADEPAGLSPVIDHLRGLHQHLQYSCLRTSIWRPTADDLASLRFAIKFGNPPLLREAVERNVATRSTSLIASKPRSFTELVMKLLLPRPRHERSLAATDRARALEVLTNRFVKPQLVELENAPVRGWESCRRLMLIERFTAYCGG